MINIIVELTKEVELKKYFDYKDIEKYIYIRE